jgi:hypothetical protein
MVRSKLGLQSVTPSLSAKPPAVEAARGYLHGSLLQP